jgi:hemolysin III
MNEETPEEEAGSGLFTQAFKTPKLRGVSHQYAFFASLLTGVAMILSLDDPHVQSIAGVYVASVTCLFGVSALYHRFHWPEHIREWIRRLDHTMIFVLIAGSYTPICTLVLEGDEGEWLLQLAWASVVLGAALKLVWNHAPKWVMSSLYVAVGWIAGFILGDLYASVGPVFVALLLLGGLFYTVGAVIYAMKRPDPWPEVFGYHEIFHTLVVAAAAVHFAIFYVFIFAA